MVEFWRKGNLPARHADVELLARLLVRRGRLTAPGWRFLTTPAMAPVHPHCAMNCFPADNPVPPPPTAAPFQPAAGAPFWGRELRWIRWGKFPVWPGCLAAAALVGMGGAGKSTLAAQFAHTPRRDFPDGVLWSMPSPSSRSTILQSWAVLRL